MTNRHHTVLYVGVTADLPSRIIQHREKKYPRSFTARYNIAKLVYYEGFLRIEEAIAREKQVKKYSRIKKTGLVEFMNPNWRDLFDEVMRW